MPTVCHNVVPTALLGVRAAGHFRHLTSLRILYLNCHFILSGIQIFIIKQGNKAIFYRCENDHLHFSEATNAVCNSSLSCIRSAATMPTWEDKLGIRRHAATLRMKVQPGMLPLPVLARKDSGIKAPCHTLVPWHFTGIFLSTTSI